MTQPDFVAEDPQHKVRLGKHLPPPSRWVANRVGDDVGSGLETVGGLRGNPGPDQGYVLKLVNRFVPRLKLESHENVDDIVACCVSVALRRASMFGRAPVAADLEIAFSLFGALGDSGESGRGDNDIRVELAKYRHSVMAGAAHDYATCRKVANGVAEEALRMDLAQALNTRKDWETLLNTSETPS